jgi:hypothetical protein
VICALAREHSGLSRRLLFDPERAVGPLRASVGNGYIRYFRRRFASICSSPQSRHRGACYLKSRLIYCPFAIEEHETANHDGDRLDVSRLQGLGYWTGALGCTPVEFGAAAMVLRCGVNAPTRSATLVYTDAMLD